MFLIAIEGLDGAGKSTLCAALQAKDWRPFKVAVTPTPHEELSATCYRLRGRNPEASMLAFLLGSKAVCVEYRQADVLVVDRYVLSTIVHHREIYDLWGRSFDLFLRAMDFRSPDLTVLLEPGLTLAAQRISARSNDRPLIVELDEQERRYQAALSEERVEPLLGEVLKRETIYPDSVDEISSELVELVRRRLS